MAISFTDRELDVMTVLWDLGSATVAEVRERLPDALAYTTVLTVLRTLEEKGFVGHLQEGKAHRYLPLVERQAAGQSAVARLLETIFRGTPELLLTQLMSERSVSDDELERLRRIVDARIASKAKAPSR